MAETPEEDTKPKPPPRKPIGEKEAQENCPTAYHAILYNRVRDDRTMKAWNEEQKRKNK